MLGSEPPDSRTQGEGPSISTSPSGAKISMVTDKRVYTNSYLFMLTEEPRGQGKNQQLSESDNSGLLSTHSSRYGKY